MITYYQTKYLMTRGGRSASDLFFEDDGSAFFLVGDGEGDYKKAKLPKDEELKKNPKKYFNSNLYIRKIELGISKWTRTNDVC